MWYAEPSRDPSLAFDLRRLSEYGATPHLSLRVWCDIYDLSCQVIFNQPALCRQFIIVEANTSHNAPLYSPTINRDHTHTIPFVVDHTKSRFIAKFQWSKSSPSSYRRQKRWKRFRSILRSKGSWTSWAAGKVMSIWWYLCIWYVLFQYLTFPCLTFLNTWCVLFFITLIHRPPPIDISTLFALTFLNIRT